MLHPEKALLKWKGVPIRVDIGQICYLRRNTSHSSRKHHTFDVASLNAQRVHAVRNLVSQLSDLQRIGGARSHTVREEAYLLVKFVNWADSRGLHQVLCDQQETERALVEYFKALRELVSQSKLRRNSAAGKQKFLRLCLASDFVSEAFVQNAPRMRTRSSEYQPTEVPDQGRQGALISWCDALFSTISRQILDFGPYPFAVTENSGSTIWMLPTFHRRSAAGNARGINTAWDADTGELLIFEQLSDLFALRGQRFPRSVAGKLRRKAVVTLEETNSNRFAGIRLVHAALAAYCFATLFLAETGINLAQLLDMEWSPELVESLRSPSIVRQKFREIKYRAGGREVFFQVSLGFLPKLRTYLELREYLLQEAECTKLFVTLDRADSPAGLSDGFLKYLYLRLEALGVTLRRVSARQWRAAKQDWVVRNHGPVTAAKIMGHTLETALKAYSNGTDAAHKAEMGAFLASVEKTIVRAGAREQGIGSAVGACVDFHHPEAIAAGVAVQPDCRSSEGCLFCDKYRLHADAIDIRKLLSCRYCVRMTSSRVASLDEYDRSFGAVLRRIDFLIAELCKRESALVAEIQEDVDVRGNLDPFWAAKLEQLFELGLA